ncbi:MAG TPA: response regulator, partial [Polyangiaceae bacterium]
SQSSSSGESWSDLNQIVARAESAILQAVGGSVSMRFALSPNVARVGVAAAEVQTLLLALCREACAPLDSTRRLVIETRGLNDAEVGDAALCSNVGTARARVIVRAERVPTPASLRKVVSMPHGQLTLPELEASLQQLGGRLELVPLEEGGVAFVAHLPYVSSASSGRMPVAVGATADVILLVEDEPQVQAVTTRILRAFGYSVITAHNERTALAQGEQHGAAIRLIVSDLVLPGVSGTDLVRRLREPCEHARVLYMSGYSPEHVGALVEGASFLRKPFTAEELVRTVRELLAASIH